MSNEFRIDSDVIDALSATLNELSSGLSDTMGECSGRMSSLAKIPGFDSALGEINKQLGEVSNEVMTIGGSISRKTAEIIDHDIQTSKIADQIEVPKGFLANNSITTNYFKNSSLSKTDGTSVNQGAKDTTKQNLEDIEGTKQGLTNIYNENGVVLQDNEDIEGVMKGLGNINKAGGDMMQDADEVNANHDALHNVNKAGGDERQEADEVNANHDALHDISKNGGDEKQEANTINGNKANLGSVNNGTDTKTQNYYDNVQVQNYNLKDMNQNTFNNNYGSVVQKDNNEETHDFSGLADKAANAKDFDENEKERNNNAMLAAAIGAIGAIGAGANAINTIKKEEEKEKEQATDENEKQSEE